MKVIHSHLEACFTMPDNSEETENFTVVSLTGERLERMLAIERWVTN